jgi:hypothetical protein
MIKLGRNDRCWCGSGEKYKKCHLGRESQTPPSPWDLARRQNALMERRVCMHPGASDVNCSGKAIRAHTVSRAATLAPLAENGHVYHVDGSFGSLSRTGGRLDIRKIGINQASTFLGFCSAHDSSTFAPLETQQFTGSDEQLFLLVYRPLAKELYIKTAVAQSLKIMREADKGRPLDEQLEAQMAVFLFGAGTHSALGRLQHVKRQLDAELVAQDHSHIRACVINFDRTPDIVCSGVLQPEWDFQGNRLQDIADLTAELDWISVSLLPTPAGGAAVLAWHEKEDEQARAFVESLLRLPQDRVPDALVRLCFETLENIFMAPSWWERLDEPKKEQLKKRAMSGLPSTGSDPAGLVEDGEEYVHWQVTSVLKRY